MGVAAGTVGAVLTTVLTGTLAACGGSPVSQPSTAASASVNPAPSTQEPTADQVRIEVTIADGKVEPSGLKIDVPVGVTVVLTVTSDEDDEIHAHLGDRDGYSLGVKAGKTVTGQFRMDSPGSFEVESHHLGKIIAILNVR